MFSEWYLNLAHPQKCSSWAQGKGISQISREPNKPEGNPEGKPGGPRDLKTAGGRPLALLPLPGPPSVPSGSSLGSLELFKRYGGPLVGLSRTLRGYLILRPAEGLIRAAYAYTKY